MRIIKILLVVSLVWLILPSLSYAQVKPSTITVRVGDVDMTVEVAADPRSRETGLMYRKTLPDNYGMLFVYPSPCRVRFWMKNTYLALEAALIDALGRIRQIIKMEKIDSTKIYKSRYKVKYAIEAPLGYFERNNIKLGDICIIPDISSQ